jgi:hypothetical protein
MRIKDKESDLATNLLLGLFLVALLGISGNALKYASSHNQILGVTHTVSR